MAKVSVLVAIYNAEHYLRQCLDSLINQTLSDIQIICIDDASTDGSRAILDDYASRDSRISPIYLSENIGQAKARNEGIRIAQGEYICFLDSDDWYGKDALQKAVKVFEDYPRTDCVLFRTCLVSEATEKIYPMPPFVSLSGQEAFEKSLTWEIHGIYMVRTSIHRQYPYDTTTRAYSDDNTTRIHFLHSDEVRQCDGVYYYRQHQESVTHKVSARRFDYLRANASMKLQLYEAQVDEKLLSLYENIRWLNVIDLYMFYFWHRGELSSEARLYGLQEIRYAWNSIEVARLTSRNRWKFGYMPLRFSWQLFRFQEELYFSLRKLVFRR